MEWMLVVMVFGTAPIETQLLFPTLQECLSAEEAVRAEYADAYNQWNTWARANPDESGLPESEAFQRHRTGILNTGTCVPYRS